MVVAEESFFLVAIGKVAVFSIHSLVIGKVAVLVVVNVEVTDLKDVDGKVAVLSAAVVEVASPLDRWKLEKGGLYRHIPSVGLPVVECN